MSNKIFILFALLFFSSLSWGACTLKTAYCQTNYCNWLCNTSGGTTAFHYCPSPNNNYQGGICPNGSSIPSAIVANGCSNRQYIVMNFESCDRNIIYQCCDTQIESDSLSCVQSGKEWVYNNGVYECREPILCDSTKWECTTTTERSQTTIATDNITCIGGACFGGVYCEYVTKNITTCTNECGGTTTQENSIPIRYDGACNPDNLTDDDECTGVRCISFAKTKSYSLYKLCKSREIVNGVQQFLPRIVGGGMGNCVSNGYPESNDSTGSAGSSDSLNIPESCFTMGLDCPPPDTTNYSSNDNRTEENGCVCVPYDGITSISKIVCPDGSISIFMGSCDTWKQSPLSSSSNEPPESSSGSENSTSSGGGDLVGDWANYSQGEQIIALLGAIATNTNEKSEIKQIQTLNVALDDYTTDNNDVDVPFNRVDSIYDPSYVVDTAGLKQVIFGRVTEQNEILDTLLHPASKCPCFTFFGSGGNQAQISGSHISFPKMQFDFSSFHGFDLCHIISVIVTSLASVVAFFIGFAIFKNVSQ